MTTMFDYHTILVGTDGSELATPTVARAAWLAAHDDADLVIVCAYSELTRRQEARNVATIGGDTRIGTVLGRAAADEAMAAALLVDGEPAEALLDLAADRGTDLIVIGARHDVSLAERLLGTVASEVVRRAECEVLIVRPRAERTSGEPTDGSPPERSTDPT
jgi:nucleotide-binding universal stress UspA family protein